jgi:Chemotaxis protein histidine kinase and related kinases
MGSETQVDGEVLDRIMPALMHLVRNAIDHGIELPDQREQLGKPRVGRIEIRFAPAGDQIVVTCSDDGRGLDLERIRAKAISAGLLAASAMPTDQELMLLTLQPGFSTREVVTQISGRGVGMDVVATIVHTLNGTLAIESQPGAGYRIQLRLPASRLTLYCLLLRHGDHLLAVPANEVRSALLIEEGECVETPEGWQFCHEGHWYPLRQLDPLFGRSPGTPERRGRSVLILSSDRADQAILIDALLEGRELVVMKPGSTVPKVPGLMAVSVLGDGTVVPILDMRTILRVVESGDLKMVSWHEEADFTKPLPTVLVVDDSISMRRLLSQLVIDAGYRALTASNGMDALQILRRERVDLLLVDMEMPRMNGLELSAHLRSQPDTQTLPIGMITSRSSEKHQHQAAQVGIDRYFVKPYRDDDVIEFIQQKLAKVS